MAGGEGRGGINHGELAARIGRKMLELWDVVWNGEEEGEEEEEKTESESERENRMFTLTLRCGFPDLSRVIIIIVIMCRLSSL